MAVTREQVVQWADDSGFSSIDDPYHNQIEIADSGNLWITKRLEAFATLARADLEATIAEQAETLRVVRNEYDFKCQQLAEQVKEIERLETKVEMSDETVKNYAIFADMKKVECRQLQDDRKELRQQLSASLAREAQLREALSTCSKVENYSWMLQAHIDKALAIPSDDTALREYGANLVSRIRNKFDGSVVYDREWEDTTGLIRNGEL